MGTDPVRVGDAIGRVVGLWRYPVKAMAAEAVGEAEVSWHGVVGDRRWGFVREGRERRGFPWLTIRDLPVMARYRPRLAEPARPDRSPVVVTTPSGVELDVADPALAAELGAGLALKLDRGTFDALPLSLITTQSLATLGTLAGRPLAVGRFRPNLLVDAAEASGDGFPEEAWVGCTLRVGGALVRLDRRDKRCVVVNVDPATAERDPVVLRTIARQRQTHFGVYGSTARPGRVAVGDTVVVHELTDAHAPASHRVGAASRRPPG